MNTLRRLARHTVWHPDAIDPDEWKYRSLTRVWLPIFDLLAIIAGAWAVIWGSPLLKRLFDENNTIINTVGFAFFLVAFTALVAVVVPVLWKVEIVAKLVLMAMLAGYGGMILLMTQPMDWFPAFIILMTLVPPFIRLSVLGEEIKERRSQAAADAGEG